MIYVLFDEGHFFEIGRGCVNIYEKVMPIIGLIILLSLDHFIFYFFVELGTYMYTLATSQIGYFMHAYSYYVN